MTRLAHLQALYDAVKAGTHPGPLVLVMGSQCQIDQTQNAYHGSLDAAHALHKAVLPGPHSEVFVTLGLGGGAIIHGSNDGERPDAEAALFGTNPARAWLLAILAALIAMEDAKSGGQG